MINILRNKRGRVRNGWWIFAFYVVLGLLVVPTTFYAASRHASVTPAVQAVLAAIATGVCLLIRHEHPASVLGTLRSWGSGVPVGLALGVGIWSVVAATVWASGAVQWRWVGGSSGTMGQAAGACLAVAAVEELLFRGFAFQRLIDGVGVWPAQAVMGAYFVLTHSAGIATAGSMKGVAIVNIFFASLLFGASYLRTRSLALPVALHFALNFFQGNVLGFGVSGSNGKGLLDPTLAEGATWWTGGTFGLEASIPGTVAVALALVAVGRWGTRRPVNAALAPLPREFIPSNGTFLRPVWAHHMREPATQPPTASSLGDPR